MRKMCLLMFFLFWPSVVAYAVSPVDKDNIAAAQEYGKSKAGIAQTEFFQPWTAYEEKASRLDEVTDRAYLYTPFLLLAADARDKTANGITVREQDADKILRDYKDYMVFGVTLFAGEPDMNKKVMAVLKQGKKTINAQLIYGPDKAEKVHTFLKRSPVFAYQLYLYFASQDVIMDKPVILQVSSVKGESRFRFDLVKFR